MDATMDPARDFVRLIPDQPFPPYTYIPGRSPHPVSDPAGHSFGIKPPVPADLNPESWRSSKPYLFGIDLFNGGYYWESHVEFESLWLVSGRKGATADFLKGWIKLAAAGVKHLADQPAGVKSHAARAAQLWRTTTVAPEADPGVFLGFQLAELIAVADMVDRFGWPASPPLLLPLTV